MKISVYTFGWFPSTLTLKDKSMVRPSPHQVDLEGQYPKKVKVFVWVSL